MMEESSDTGEFVRLRERRDSVEPPNSFLCPITCEIMADPVMDADGNTYERWAITRWLEKSQQSPITRMPIASRMLVPNRALKAIIDDWRKKNNVPLPTLRTRSSNTSLPLSNRSGSSADRRLSRGRPSGRNRIGFRVSTFNVVLVAGCDSVRKVAKLLNNVPDNQRLVDGVQMVLVFSHRKNAMFACERDRNGRWHTGHRTNTHFGNVREIHLVDPENPPRHIASGSRSSRSGVLSRPHTSHGHTDSDSTSIQRGQRRPISPPVQSLVAHKRSTSGPATDGLVNNQGRSFREFRGAGQSGMRKAVSSNNNLFARNGMSPGSFMHEQSNASIDAMARSGRNSRISRPSAQEIVSGVFSPRPPLPNSASKRCSRHRPPPARELESANAMHDRAHRIRMTDAAARMPPPRDHKFALKRWLSSPIVVPEQDSAEMSSYERSTDSDFKKKKKKKKKKTHKNNAAADDEFDELPASPFREKFTDDEMAKAIQKLLRQGIPLWDAGDIVSCTMIYLKFAREQADDCPEIKRALGAGKFAIVREPDRSLALRLRRAFDTVLARVLPQKVHDDTESDRQTPSPPQLMAMLSPPPLPKTLQPSPPPMPKTKTPSPVQMQKTHTPSSTPVPRSRAPSAPPVPRANAPSPPPMPRSRAPSSRPVPRTAPSPPPLPKAQAPSPPPLPKTQTLMITPPPTVPPPAKAQMPTMNSPSPPPPPPAPLTAHSPHRGMLSTI